MFCENLAKLFDSKFLDVGQIDGRGCCEMFRELKGDTMREVKETTYDILQRKYQHLHV